MVFTRRLATILVLVFMASCAVFPQTPNQSATPIFFPTSLPTGAQSFPTPTSPAKNAGVPQFDHIIIFILENKGYESVIGNPQMPVFNRLAAEYTLLSQYYAVAHPSLPNYIALLGGSTYGITSDCKTCYLNAPSLPDLIEENGRTWKAYLENMQEPCQLDSAGKYVQRHNPFIYFDPIRLDLARCTQYDLPFEALYTDIETLEFPNFMFIVPNNCNNGHDCGLDTTDRWLTEQLNALVPALNMTGDTYLIVITWDEGQDDTSCCGLPKQAGGRVPMVLVSPYVKNGFTDTTPYSHYSLLKTIAVAWGLPYLGHAADESTTSITAPWK